MAVVGMIRSGISNRVMLGGSIGRHTRPYPGLPNKEPIFAGAGLVPPTQLAGPDGSLPAGQLLTIIDDVEFIPSQFSLMAIVDTLQPDMISNVYIRRGPLGPILIDLGPQLQLRHLGPTSSVMTIEDGSLPTHVVDAIRLGEAYVSIVFPHSIHPDGVITGRISVETTTPGGVPADYSDNHEVDAADYAVWRKHNGENFQLSNEVPGVTPGHVTQQDYDAWHARFGDTSVITAHSAGTIPDIDGRAPIPEPSTIVLFLVSLCALGKSRRNDCHGQRSHPVFLRR